MSIELHTLVNDALHYRRKGPGAADSCFVFNEAAMELADESDEALPLIEHVLINDVEQVVSGHPSYQETGDFRYISPPFLGLDGVMYGYISIGERYDPERAVAFIEHRVIEIQRESILSVGAYWGGTGPKERQGESPSAVLMAYVRRCAEVDDSHLRQRAIDTLAKLGNSRTN